MSEAARRRRISDVSLNVEWGGRGRELLLLHGFTGSVATWQPHLLAFQAIRRTIAVDLLGHGRSDSPAEPERYRMERCLDDLLALLDSLGAGRVDVLGYSLGARIALHLAVAAPDRVGALVLESGSPGLANPAERAARMRADEALADRIEREGTAAFVEFWEALPLFASQARLPVAVRDRLRAQRLQNSAEGLANSLRGLGTGRPEPLWDQLPTLAIPTLLLVGEEDQKFRALAQEMAAALPRAQVIVVPGAGHAVHLEQPAAFDAAVVAFLVAQDSATRLDEPIEERRKQLA
jgi:2-succinyl-6-hydroxy-2,4-cyclohexadiene-1-carboxylate synthase